MTDITIPDAAVEAAARLSREENPIPRQKEWDAASPWIRQMWMDGVRPIIAAAAPHIAAQALMDAADEVRGYAYTPDDVREVAHGDDYADGITDAHHVFDRLLAARADRIEAGNG